MGADPFSATMQAGAQMFGASSGAQANRYAADQQRAASEAEIKLGREQLGENARQFNESDALRKRAYNETVGAGASYLKAGEDDLMGSLQDVPSNLGQVEQDIRAGGTESMQDASRQMGADLAKQGVRGGQAATLLNRGTGTMAKGVQRDITQLRLQDEQERMAMKRAYLAAKAQRGQAATLGGAN